MNAVKIAALSVDLDELPNYERIYGLPAEPRAARLVYDVAIPRMRDFARSIGAPLDLFAVGADVVDPDNASALRAATAEGHLVESHSMRHAYDLTRHDAGAIRRDVAESFAAIEAAVGRRPLGFRAPGYLVNEALFDALEAEGARFDASVLPSPWYFAAKLGAIAWTRLRGRTSASLPRGLSQALAPSAPYRPGRTHRGRGGRAFVELPMTTLPGLGVPVIGTTVPHLPRKLTALLGRLRFVSVELHGIDFLRASDGAEHVAAAGPELRVDLEARLAAFATLVHDLRAAGFRFVHLAEAAEHFSTRC